MSVLRHRHSTTSPRSSHTQSQPILSPSSSQSKHHQRTATKAISSTSRNQPIASASTTGYSPSKHDHHTTTHSSSLTRSQSPSRSHHSASTNTARYSPPPASLSDHHHRTKSQHKASSTFTTSNSHSKQYQHASAISSTGAPSSSSLATTNMKSHHTSSSSQHSAPRSLADSYLHFSEQRMTTAATSTMASLVHQSPPSYSFAITGSRSASPLAARRYRSRSLSSPVVEELLNRRQHASSYSESPVTGYGNSSTQLDKREYYVPRTVYGPPSSPPPSYHSSPVVNRNFEQLLKQNKPSGAETDIRHRRSNSDVSHRGRSPSPSPRHSDSQTLRYQRVRSPSPSPPRYSESQTLRSNRARSPSPSPRHSTISDARQRRAAMKKQESVTASSTSSTSRNIPSLDADRLKDVSSNLDNKDPSSSSRGSLRRSSSTSSVADCLKWEGRNERKSSPETLVGNSTKVLSSQGSFDGTHRVGLTGGENHRKKSPKRRIRSLLKNFMGK